MDVDDFFAEQERRMNLPDEDIDEYIRNRLEGLRAKRAVDSWTNTGSDDAIAMLDSHSMRVSNLPQHHTSFEMASTRSAPLDNLPTQLKRKISETPPIDDGPDKRSKTGKHRGTQPVVPDFPGRAPHNETLSALSDDPAAKRAPISATGIPASGHYSAGSLARNGSTLDRNTSGTACPWRRSTSRSPILQDSPVDITVTTRSRKPLVCGGQNNVNSSTDLELEGDHQLASNEPRSSELYGAVRGAGRSIELSNHASSHHERSRAIKKAKSVGLEDSPISSTVDTFSTSQRLRSCGALSKSAVAIQDHAQEPHPTNDPSEHPQPCVSPVRFPLSIDSRADGTTHVSVPRHSSETDVSNITSPGPTPLPRGGSKRAKSQTSDIQLSSSSPVSAEPKSRRTVHSVRKPKATSSTTKGSKKAQLVTPLEYAQRLQANLAPIVARKTSYLQGKRIFYVGGDMQYAGPQTRGRMEYIVKHGGTLVPKYDPALVTHIVTDANARSTLRTLSLKSLSEIPDHIPTVTWSWVISGYGRMNRDKGKTSGNAKNQGTTKAVDRKDGDDDNVLDLEFFHAAFPERIDASSGWQNASRLEKVGNSSERAQSSKTIRTKNFNDGNGDVSGISDFTQENPTKKDTTTRRDACLTVLPPPPLDLKSSEGPDRTRNAAPEPPDVRRSRRLPPDVEKGGEDPLAEYYAQAKAELEAAWKYNESDSDDGNDDEDKDFEAFKGPAPKRGFTCDRKELQRGVCVNQDVVDKLEELMELHKAKPSDHDRWRVFSYAKCIRALRNYPKPIRSFSEARSIRGVGEKTALKIMEIIDTGGLRRIAYEKTEDVEATKIFQGIYGVGRQTAFTWFASGIRSLDDIRARKDGLKLSPAQEIGLKFYDDINSRIPRAEVEKIFNMIKPEALAIDSNIFIEVMGSFRRGKADCGDIDILITRPTTDGRTHQGVLPLLLERLHAAGIMTEDLALPGDFSALELTYRGLCKLPEADAKRRRIDILCVPWECRGAALLYYTGDDIFNRAMRLKANVLGYSLNQRGLYSGVVRDPRDRRVKMCGGNVIASETEEEIFRILGVPWQEPHERVRG